MLAMAMATHGAAGADEAHFAPGPDLSVVSLGDDVLTPAERQFIDGLPEIRVAMTSTPSPPFETLERDGRVGGSQAQTLEILARTFGLRIRPVLFPNWPAVLDAVRRHDADMVLTIAVTPAQLKDFEFTLGTAAISFGIFRRADRPDLTLEAGTRVALERGYASHETLARLYPEAEPVTTDDTVQALQAVRGGAADAYFGNLLQTLARPDLQQIELQQVIDVGGMYHFAVRKDWAPLAHVLNRGIASMRVLVPGLAAAPPLDGARNPLGAQPLSLDPAQAARLAAHAVWRVGRVDEPPDFSATWRCRLARSPPWENVACRQPDGSTGSLAGLAADYVGEVSQRLGVGVVAVDFDSEAAMVEALRAGRIDAATLQGGSVAQAGDFGFSTPYLALPYVLVARTDAPVYWDLGRLEGKRVALPPNEPLRTAIQRDHPRIELIAATSDADAMAQVAGGRVDAAVVIKLVANAQINNDTGNTLRIVDAVNAVDAEVARFAIATSPKMAELVPLIDRALADISPAERKRLFGRWVAVDRVPPFPWRRHAAAIAIGVAAASVLTLAAVVWLRRRARDNRHSRRMIEEIDDIGRTMPGVAFRYVLGADMKLRHTFYSSGAGEFLGMTIDPKKTLLQMLWPVATSEQHEALSRAGAESRQTGEPFRQTVEYQHPQRGTMWLRIEAVRSTTSEGRTAWTGYVVDVSPQHRLQQALAHESRERYLVLAQASHELRAPTHTLTLALRSHCDTTLSPERRAQALSVANDTAQSLAALLDDVLDVAQLDADAMLIRPQMLDLPGFARSVAAAQVEPMAERGLRFELLAADDLPQILCTDGGRLRQVLVNLLDNAGKYTAKGTVALRVTAARFPTGLPAIRFDVVDTGVGIDPDRQRQLFEPFPAGLPSPVRPGERSTGLGLAVCRRLVHLMGGTIDLISLPGRGTTVQVHLPLRIGAPADPRPLKPTGQVLLCDDDEVGRTLLAEVLASCGIVTVECSDMRTALDTWREGQVRAVITDLVMPDGSGYDLIAAIELAEATLPQRTALLICSGNPPPPTSEPLPTHDAFFTKPVSMRALLATLTALGIGPASAKRLDAAAEVAERHGR